MKDILKKDKPPNKGQAESTFVYTLYRKSPLKEDNLSKYKGQNGWSRRCPYREVPLYSEYFIFSLNRPRSTTSPPVTSLRPLPSPPRSLRRSAVRCGWRTSSDCRNLITLTPRLSPLRRWRHTTLNTPQDLVSSDSLAAWCVSIRGGTMC